MPLGHLHVGMTLIQNGGYFWLNYCVYLCCLEFLSEYVSASEESIKVAEIAERRKSRWRLSGFVVSAFLEFQPSKNENDTFSAAVKR